MYQVNTHQLLQLAITSNARWCSFVCAAKGIGSKFENGVWRALGAVPLYYPNIITVSTNVTEQYIQLRAGQVSGNFSVKDSFCRLDLAASGFRKLFEGQWLLAPKDVRPAMQFDIIKEPAVLRQWESSWSNSTVSGLFNAVLLGNSAVRFIAVRERGAIVAGAVTNSNNEVISISNFFCNVSHTMDCLLTCLAAALEAEPNIPVVGYQKGEMLPVFQQAGFVPIGPLRVWQRMPA